MHDEPPGMEAVPEKDGDVLASRQYLTFSLGDVTYGIDVTGVEVVLEMQPVTRVPNSPPWMRGVTNHRGAVIPVIDIKQKFRMSAGDGDCTKSIIVLETKFENESISVGMLADSVSEVVVFSASEIDVTPRIGTKENGGIVFGIGKKNDTFILLIDIQEALREGNAVHEP